MKRRTRSYLKAAMWCTHEFPHASRQHISVFADFEAEIALDRR
jgi:hypothetical protein